MKLLLAMLVALIALQGAPAAAHEIGDMVGPVIANPGGAICDTEDQAKQAIDVYDSGQGKMPASCGFVIGNPLVLIEVVGLHESSIRTYIIVKVTFLPPSTLGVQYAWQKHSKAPDAIDGEKI